MKSILYLLKRNWPIVGSLVALAIIYAFGTIYLRDSVNKEYQEISRAPKIAYTGETRELEEFLQKAEVFEGLE